MAKYVKKKRKNRRTPLIIALAVLSVLLLVLAWGLENSRQEPESPETASTTDALEESTSQNTAAVEETATIQTEEMSDGLFALENGLTILEVGKYTGIYMEDGTDEVVADVLMLIVRNDSEQAIQYAELTVPTSQGDAKFTLSTIPSGERIVLLEQSRMIWSADEHYDTVTAANTAVFSDLLTLCEDQLKIQALDGVINVTNISGGDIAGDIVIYYKNASSDLLYGGITYRIRLEGGLKADELRQITASHFSASGSRIMFVSIG